MGPSDAHLGPPPTEQLRVSDSLTAMGLPCCDALCLYVPPPLPRRVTRKIGGCCLPSTAAFPALESGRHSRLLFRGLLRVHSCCGPQICWPPLRRLLSGWLDDPSCPKAAHP
jgi:hypothetical protein